MDCSVSMTPLCCSISVSVVVVYVRQDSDVFLFEFSDEFSVKTATYSYSNSATNSDSVKNHLIGRNQRVMHEYANGFFVTDLV